MGEVSGPSRKFQKPYGKDQNRYGHNVQYLPLIFIPQQRKKKITKLIVGPINLPPQGLKCELIISCLSMLCTLVSIL